MKIYIVGTGVDGESTLTKAAEKAIAESGLLIGADRIVKPFMKLGKEVFITYRPADIAKKLNSFDHSTAAVLMSGDCGFFQRHEKAAASS